MLKKSMKNKPTNSRWKQNPLQKMVVDKHGHAPWPAPSPGRVRCTCPPPRSAARYLDVWLCGGSPPRSGSCAPGKKCHSHVLKQFSTQVSFRWSKRLLLYLPSAFALVDDLQGVLPSCGVLHALSDHREVPVAEHASHLVPVWYVGWHRRDLVHQNLGCREETRGEELNVLCKLLSDW